MRALLDTHVFIWWMTEGERLSPAARRAIERVGNEIFVSAATAWELATKYRIGRLPNAAAIVNDVAGQIRAEGFFDLPIAVEHGQRAGLYASPHRDPFDRILAAQAQAEELTLISNDPAFDTFPIVRLW